MIFTLHDLTRECCVLFCPIGDKQPMFVYIIVSYLTVIVKFHVGILFRLKYGSVRLFYRENVM